MIPHILSLTNFLCYRQAKVDFTGIHVACLAGANGAGKSALLDGLTWAVWGKARTRRDDELVRLGADGMAVEFTFEMGGQTYRIIRRRRSGRRGGTLLDFQVQDGPRWRSIAEGGVRATQAKIERVLHLDYVTFVNSAFLRQGRADEFTVKTATERKRVLGEILGLDRWQGYEEQAKEHLRAIKAEEQGIGLQLQEIEAELARRPEYEAQLRAAWRTVEGLAERLAEAEAAYQRIETARTELRHAASQVAAQQKRVARLARDLAALEQEREAHRRSRDEYAALLAQAEEIEAGYRAYRRAVAEERALAEKLRRASELHEQVVTLRARLATARQRLDMERQNLKQRIAELEALLPGEPLLKQYEDVRAQIAHRLGLAEGQKAAQADLSRISEEQAALRAENNGLKAEMEALREQIVQLEQAEAECPLCRQPLSEEHRVALLGRLQAEGKELGDTYRANKSRIRELGRQARSLKDQIADGDRLLRGLPGLQRREAALAERIERGREAEVRLEEARTSLARLERQLAGEEYATSEREQLERVLRQAEELGYDAESHEKLRRAVAEGEVFAERRARLAVAEEGLRNEEAALERLAETVAQAQARLEAERAEQKRWEERVAALQVRLRDEARVEAELQRVRGEEAVARQRLGAARQRLEACKALENRRREKRRRRDELAAEQAIYEELRLAFGVKGVPAMVIEAAVPEIEAEANRLLSRMTNGRMHVRFDTQKETRAGEVRETLEIKIADEVGTRPYENYSGGEQFRVNFAIRVALSKLLARRAGARLQTLVIDEGFGTQDATGRERLIEAINAVQDDFARVLVITHIEELQDAFPTRIVVTKTPAGSTVRVL